MSANLKINVLVKIFKRETQSRLIKFHATVRFGIIVRIFWLFPVWCSG